MRQITVLLVLSTVVGCQCAPVIGPSEGGPADSGTDSSTVDAQSLDTQLADSTTADTLGDIFQSDSSATDSQRPDGWRDDRQQPDAFLPQDATAADGWRLDHITVDASTPDMGAVDGLAADTLLPDSFSDLVIADRQSMDTADAAASPDSDIDPCGNGQIDPGEICDLAIAENQPGSCPPYCHINLPTCGREILVGTGCQQYCQLERITQASDGDDCCPPGVTPIDDADCTLELCLDAPWPQYRFDQKHSGVGDVFQPCASWSSQAPELIWTTTLVGPVWDSPAAAYSDHEGGPVFLAAAGDANTGVGIYEIEPTAGAVVWSRLLPADSALDAPGQLTKTWAADFVLSSSAGGLRVMNTYQDDVLVLNQLPQELPNVVVDRRGTSIEQWLSYLDSNGALRGINIDTTEETFGPVTSSSCPSSSSVAGRAVASHSYDVMLLTERTADGDAVAVKRTANNDPQEEISCHRTPAPVFGLPLLAGRNLVYLTEDGEIVSQPHFNYSTSFVHWRVAVGAPQVSPVMGPFNHIYFGAGDNILHCYDRFGHQQWQLQLPTSFSSPAITGYGIALVGGDNGTLYAVQDGVILWQIELSSHALTSPIVAAQARVVVGDQAGNLYGLQTPVTIPDVVQSPPFDYGPATVTTHHLNTQPSTYERLVYTYDAQARVENTYSYTSVDGVSYQPETWTSYSYDGDGLLSETVEANYGNGWLAPHRRDTYTYNNGQREDRIVWRWQTDDWQRDAYYDYIYQDGLMVQSNYGDYVDGDRELSVYTEYDYEGNRVEKESNWSWDPYQYRSSEYHHYTEQGRLSYTRRASRNRDYNFFYMYAYDALGRLVRKSLGNDEDGPMTLGQRWRYSYTSDGRLHQISEEVKPADDWQLNRQVEIVTTDSGSSHTFEQSPYPMRDWVLDYYGFGEVNGYQ